MKKKMAHNEKQETRGLNGIPTELETAEQIAQSAEELEKEVQNIKKQLQTVNRNSTIRISVIFIVSGILSLALSTITGSQVLAFIGLGLTFWGALFFLVRPITCVRGSLLSTTAATLYLTIDRIIKDLNAKGRVIYVPPYTAEVYLPKYLKGLKETVMFIPQDTDQVAPSIEEIASSKFITKKPKGIILIPPGSGFLEQIEKTLRTGISKMSLEDLCTTLPQLIMEDFQLAKEIEMKTENNQIYLKTTDSIYRNLYHQENLKSVQLLGDPLTSAVACTIARATGRLVTIQNINVSPDTQTIETTFQLAEG